MSEMIDPEWANVYGVSVERLLALPWQIPEEIREAGRPLTTPELAERLDVPAPLVERVCVRLRRSGRLRGRSYHWPNGWLGGFS